MSFGGSGGGLSKMFEQLSAAQRQKTLDNDPLFRKAQGKPTQQQQRPGKIPGRILTQKGILGDIA
jgi:hypothetical protein